MKVLLCQSYLGSALYPLPVVFPLGLAYIASSIKAEHEVHCWDPNITQSPMKELPRLLEKIEPQVVGLSLRNVDSSVSTACESFYPQFVSFLRIIRERLPNCKIVVGGAGFSLFAEEIMSSNPEIDFGVVSEGEQSFSQLLRDMDHPERIDNLVFRKNGRICFTEHRFFENFESSPFPSRELFNLKEYRKKPYSINLMTKRGCEFQCIFCPNSFISGCKYRLRSPKSVVDEIEQMKNCFDLDNYFFADSTFNHPFDYARKVCQELAARKLDINWMADFHPGFTNESFIKEAVQSGCTMFNFSPDGASDNALAALRKGMCMEDIKKTISSLKKVEGSKACFNFMYDLPQYNSEHIAGLTRLIPQMECSLREKLFIIYLTKIRIYPHSQLYNLAVKEKLISKNTNILYPIYYSSSSKVENMIADLSNKTCFVVSKVKRSLIKSK
jgi:radical SAM superfamily enzyme YgiQ (UPF0313 family)